MVNIWEYVGAKNVRIITKDGEIYEGYVISVDDSEEFDDTDEDIITIEMSSDTIIGFKQSEVNRIERI